MDHITEDMHMTMLVNNLMHLLLKREHVMLILVPKRVVGVVMSLIPTVSCFMLILRSFTANFMTGLKIELKRINLVVVKSNPHCNIICWTHHSLWY